MQAKNKAKLVVMKDKISKEKVAATPTLDPTGTTLAAPTSSIPVYDEEGNVLGYLAMWTQADLLA